jgi:membrane carboxypeptidase/penicillin-binding protein
MRGVIDRGTGGGIRSRYGIQADVAGKTGTTQDNTDGWFILMHPHLVAGAWVGFNDNRVTLSDYWGQGARSALPIVGDFFQQSLRAKVLDPEARFDAPRLVRAPAPAPVEEPEAQTELETELAPEETPPGQPDFQPENRQDNYPSPPPAYQTYPGQQRDQGNRGNQGYRGNQDDRGDQGYRGDQAQQGYQGYPQAGPAPQLRDFPPPSPPPPPGPDRGYYGR